MLTETLDLELLCGLQANNPGCCSKVTLFPHNFVAAAGNAVTDSKLQTLSNTKSR
jgi:hypothetical protein